jgi:hypothetical protein
VTETFSYTIEDTQGGTDTATVEVTINGSGPNVVTGSGTATLGNGQDVTVTLVAPNATEDGNADMSLNIRLSAVLQPSINVFYVIDTSGSTASQVLAQEVAALTALTNEIASLGFADGAMTITLVPFSTTAGPDATGDQIRTVTLDASDDGAMTDAQAVEHFLHALRANGYTNYIAALEATTTRIGQIEAVNGPGTNLVYFLSDGQPYVFTPGVGGGNQSVADIAAAAAPLHDIALVSAFELGNVNALEYLDAVDNTGGAESINNPATDLTAALLGAPIPEGALISADLFIFADGTTLSDTIALDVSLFTESPLGYSFNIGAVAGLADDLGEMSTATLEVQFDGDDDGIADTTITASVDIFGY